jgi:hypothetical protein
VTLNLRPKTITVLVFSLILVVMFIKIKSPFNFYDEGFALFSSIRVMAGDAPYKDFWAIYPPGQFYTLAGFMKIFGPNLLSSRIYDTLVRFALVLGVYLVGKRVTSRGLALLAGLIAGLMLASAGFYSYAVFPAMTLGMWAGWSWLKYTEAGQKRWLVLSGLLAGCAALIRWDIGAYASVSILAPGYLLLLSDRWSSSTKAGQRAFFPLKAFFTPFKTLVWIIGPALAVALLGYGAVALNSGWSSLYDQAFYFPAFILHSMRWLAYPPLWPGRLISSFDWWRFYLPILILVPAAVGYTVQYLRNPGRGGPRFYGTLTLILFAGLLFNQALSRYDVIHVMPSSIVTFMVCGALYYQALPRFTAARKTAVLVLLLALPTIIYTKPAFQELGNALANYAPWGCYSQLERAGCIPLDPNQAQAVEYIQGHTRAGEAIFVGNQKHDRIFVNDVGFYYLADRPSITRYEELYPGVANTLPVQNEISAEIEAGKVQWIVLVDIWDSTEPNGSALSSGVFALDEYLRANYAPRATFGNYQVLERR